MNTLPTTGKMNILPEKQRLWQKVQLMIGSDEYNHGHEELQPVFPTN